MATVQLECQTSFEAIDYKIDTNIVYCSVIDEEQIDRLEDEYEALLLDDGQVDIKQVIEDELILALPIAINKASNEVDIQMSYGELPKEDASSKKNPFKVLERLNIK
ncbi:MAG: YceD family protein [Kangiellaceae bacterium]|nr:YceD family protein [Kangiellaceae bacterium]